MVVFADNRDASGYSWALVPFRRLMAATCPPSVAVRIDSVELTATCPEGWHRSFVAVASPAASEA